MISASHASSFLELWISISVLQIIFFSVALPAAKAWALSFLIGHVLYGLRSILVLLESFLMAIVGGGGHLLRPAAMRGSRAAVNAGERRAAEPHSIAFSCRTHLQKHVVYCLLHETNLVQIFYTLGCCLTTKARGMVGWMDGRMMMDGWWQDASYLWVEWMAWLRLLSVLLKLQSVAF